MKKYLTTRNIVIAVLILSLIGAVLYANNVRLKYDKITEQYWNLVVAGDEFAESAKGIATMYTDLQAKYNRCVESYGYSEERIKELQQDANAYKVMVNWAKNSDNGINCIWALDNNGDSLRCRW